MSIDPEFSITFLATILISRVTLFIRPTSSPTIFRLRLHHWMYGLVIGLVGLALSSKILFSIGFGLFIDELTFLLIRGNSHKDYISSVSIVGTIMLALLVILMSGYLMELLFA